MTHRTFVASGTRWKENQADVLSLRVISEASYDHTDKLWPGVAIFNRHGCRMVLTTEQALRLANDIADALQAAKDGGL
ncbi:hypothetical protein [Arthrobacter sp. 8AJ]|uniref:hypothetical protein n=1 Tax=Arthrobacter sp. 8AJ TaxID=2653130 RepID=UPI0012F29F59|nr:hypothetical protein [Arthrobacter sp. 8AJ]VXB57214.1 conserved hypothetical protein [Arthrobacter sp. 8AJ]